jgi:micrococcal nuclease
MFDLCSIRRLALAGLIAVPSAAGSAAGAADRLAGPVPAVVERMVDGDTIGVRAHIWLDQQITVRVRLAGVNTPEITRPECERERELAEAAKAFVESLAPVEVELFDIQHDKYAGRVDARVVLPDGRDLGVLVLAEGHGVPYPGRGDWCPAPARASPPSTPPSR